MLKIKKIKILRILRNTKYQLSKKTEKNALNTQLPDKQSILYEILKKNVESTQNYKKTKNVKKIIYLIK